MQVLAFKDPVGRVHIMEETMSLPPLGAGYEWTTVVRPDYVADENPPWSEDEHACESGPDGSDGDAPDEPANDEPVRVSRKRHRGIVDMLAPLLTPRENQTPKERAQELIDALSEETRGKLAKLARALKPPKAEDLPPFPGARS